MNIQDKIKKSLIISYYEDYIDHLTDDIYLSELIKHLRSVIEDGGKVVLEIRYVNATPDIVNVFSTIKEVDEWQNKINEMKIKMKC